MIDSTPLDLERDRSEILFVDTAFVTVPLTEDAQRALTKVLTSHADEMDAALAPFGLKARDVAVPMFERCVYRSEVE